MKHFSTLSRYFSSLLVLALFSLGPLQAQGSDSLRSVAYFDLDNCIAQFNDQSNQDYSEMTAEITNGALCTELEVIGGFLYRELPFMNPHSCTPGVEDSPAMCVSAEQGCNYSPSSMRDIHIDVRVTPGPDGTGTLSTLQFYEQAPETFSWINGNSGPNNNPTLFAVRVLKGGEEIFLSADNETQLEWNLRTFDFSSNAEFTVSEPTVFNIELLAYCPNDNGSPMSVWDIDEVSIISTCCEGVEGGVIEGGPFEFCVGDGEPDNATGITLSGNEGDNSQWVVTDTLGVILGLPPSPEAVDFDGAGPGVCLIWHLSFADGLEGAELGNNASTDLVGCYSLSNPITVVRNQPEGGMLEGGPFEFCVGDGEIDTVSGIVLSGNSGANSAWVVTDTLGEILGLPPTPEAVNFDEAGDGVCLIWHLSFADGLEGAEVGNNAMTDLVGCYSLSNPIEVIRNQPEGGMITGGPFEFCVGDGEPDMVSGIELTGNVGENSQWVVTDTLGVILGLPPSPEAVNFDESGPGVCLIWHLSFYDTIAGAELGNNAMTDLVGCYSLSNPIEVVRNQPEGGMLEGGPFEFCVGDGEIDTVSGIILSGNSGTNSAWVVTDTLGEILGLPPSPEAVNFDEAGDGVCLIWHISFADGLEGAEVGNNAMTDLEGCYSLSNPIEVIRNQPEGGELTGGPFEFCVGDGIADTVFGIELTGNAGANSGWVVTDTLGVILGLPPSPEAVNFDEAGDGTCLIWHISFADGLEGAELGNNAMTDLVGCYSLSNPIEVIRNGVSGGTLTGGPFEFCVGDEIEDFVSGIELSGNSGDTGIWVITDTTGLILGLPPMPGDVNFDEAGGGVCLIWHLSTLEGFEGAEVGNNALTDFVGCYSLSNPIEVIRNQPEGGVLSGAIFEFCVGDGDVDTVSGIELLGNSGPNNQWVVTDVEGTILGLPPRPGAVNFDEAGGGVCYIWHLSYEDGLEGLEVGNNATADLAGCFSLSNPITVVRNQPDGGVIEGGPFEFCVNDGIPDTALGIILSNQVGESSQWVVTDTVGEILGLPASPEEVNFDGAGPGVCLIWHLSYYDTLLGAELGNNATTDLVGCFDLSNSIEVVRLEGADCDGLTSGGEEMRLGVFPNPSSDQITLEMANVNSERVTIEIYDARGALRRSQSGYFTEINKPIDVSDLDPGQYYVRVIGKDRSAVKTFIVL